MINRVGMNELRLKALASLHGKAYYSKISNSLSYKLNIARALSALVVMLVHLRGSMFLPYNELSKESTGIINLILFFITRIGYECVLIFFVLSGFLVGGQFIGEYFKNEFSFQKYFVNRFSRMWAVLLPALLLGWVLDGQTLILDPSLDFGYKLTLPIFIGNVFFMQTILVPTFGSNNPLWSLAHEMLYYLIFPLYFLLCIGKTAKILKIVFLVIFTSILYYFIPYIMILFPLWLLGVLIRFIPPMNWIKKAYFGYLFLFLLIISIFYSNYFSTLFGNYLVGISFALNILYWMNQQNSSIVNNSTKKLVDFVANFSFSLYAIHYVLINYFVALIKNNGYAIRFQNANLIHWSVYIIIAIAITAISYFFYWLFEKRTFILRKWFNKLLQID